MKRLSIVANLLLFAAVCPWVAAQTSFSTPDDRELWYGLYMTGNKVGYSVSRVDALDDGRTVLEDDALFKLRMGGLKQDMRIYSKRTYDAAGRLERIESRIDDMAGTNSFLGVVEGEVMKLESRVGGKVTHRELPRPDETLEDSLKMEALLAGDPQIGDTLSMSVFEPMYGIAIEGTSTIAGVEERLLDGVATKVYRVETTLSLMNITSIAFVTEDGLTLEDVVAGGIITMRLEPEHMAKDVQYTNDTIISNAALVDKRIERARERETLLLDIEGPLTIEYLPEEDRAAFVRNGAGYRFEGRVDGPEGAPPAVLPVTKVEVSEWLKPTLYVQSDDPRFAKKAREILGGETDAFAASTELTHWVYDNVRSTFSARLTNSLEVLENMEGDCTEHSMLFVGLARAAGLPAREVAGLIYVDRPKPGFYFHQWATVWVGKWIDVDPTFDQPVADATHIKLIEGDLLEQTKILPVIGQLTIEVVDAD